MTILHVSDDQFTGLPDYTFTSHYHEVQPGLSMHYVDEGGPAEETMLLLHGEPSWSFLYRKMIPVLTAAGYRVVAPDLIGFGKSGKPAGQADYSYQSHLEWLQELITQLDLQHVCLFCQDWGGLLGLRLATDEPERYEAIIAANTFLPTGEHPMPKAFLQWRQFSQEANPLPIGHIINMGTVSNLSPEVIEAYDAPFPEESYKAGAKVFPMLVPVSAEESEAKRNREAWKKLEQWKKPFLTLFGDSDPIMRGAEKIFQQRVPGAKNAPHAIIEGAGHFLQEDKGEEVARLTIRFLQDYVRKEKE